MVHEAPAASELVAAVGQVPPAFGFDNVAAGRVNPVPPPRVKDRFVSAVLPVLTAVSTSGVLVLPVAQVPKSSGVGPTLRLRTSATEVPLTATGEPDTAVLPVTVTVAVEVVPTVAEAAYCTLMVQTAPAATVP